MGEKALWACRQSDADADAPAPAKKRERVLEEHEIKAFWQAAGESVWPFASIYKLALLTGARREEVAAMRWAELDLDAGVWTLPAQEDFTFQRKRRDGTEFFEGRTKNARAHRVPLPSMALALLDRAAILKIKAELGYPSGSDLVFSITGGTPPSGFSKQKRVLDLRMAKLLGGKFKPWRIHDLRRTCATGMEDLGIDTRVVETALNHVSGTKAGIVGIYQRAKHRDAVKTAFKAWAAQVAHLTGDDPGPSNVIPLKRPATQE
jgi:integrase